MHVFDDAGDATDEPASAASASTATAFSIPKEIWRLADALSGALDTPGLFLQGGYEAEMATIRDCVDSNTDFDPMHRYYDIVLLLLDCMLRQCWCCCHWCCSPLSYASVFMELLSSFREPIIPTVYFPVDEFRTVSVQTWCVVRCRQGGTALV